jgi:hypothetical protein
MMMGQRILELLRDRVGDGEGEVRYVGINERLVIVLSYVDTKPYRTTLRNAMPGIKQQPPNSLHNYTTLHNATQGYAMLCYARYQATTKNPH